MDVSLCAFGIPFRLRADDADAACQLLRGLPPESCQIPPSPRCRCYTICRRSDASMHQSSVYDLRVGARSLVQAASLEEAAEQLEGDLQLHIAERAAPWVFLHAGAVCWKKRAILLPGRSCAGKSTLVAGLLRAGAEYLSDEYAVLGEDNKVYPYARPVSLRRPGAAPLRCTPEQFGSVAVTEAVPVALIAILSYQKEPKREITRLSTGEALLNLLMYAIAVQRRPQDILRRLARLTLCIPVVHGDRGEAEEVAARLLKMSETASSIEAQHVLRI